MIMSEHGISRDRFNQLKVEISKLKEELTKINDEKEKWFNEKEKLKNNVKELVSRVKLLRESKRKDDERIKNLKGEREGYNKEVKEEIEEIKKLKEERRGVISKSKNKLGPDSIKARIEELEKKIETEALSFDKEKELMKKLKKLKKDYDDKKGIIEIEEKGDKIVKSVEESKNKGEVVHKQIQEIAIKSQVDFLSIKEVSNEIDKINREQEEAFAKFLEMKKRFNEVNDVLEEKLEGAAIIKNELDKEIKDKRLSKKAREEELLANKVKDVEVKLKEKKKLTNEDLLVFQGSN